MPPATWLAAADAAAGAYPIASQGVAGVAGEALDAVLAAVPAVGNSALSAHRHFPLTLRTNWGKLP